MKKERRGSILNQSLFPTFFFEKRQESRAISQTIFHSSSGSNEMGRPGRQFCWALLDEGSVGWAPVSLLSFFRCS